LVLGNDFLSSAPEPCEELGEGNNDGGNEEDGHDGEGKDPLEGDDLAEELTNTEGGAENAEGEAHSVILEGDEEEKSVDEDTPDSNISKDAAEQTLSVECNSTVPVQGNEGPGQGSRDGWEVDPAGRVGVAEVERRKVEEVDDQEHLSPDEVGADEEHDPAKVEEIVGDEVAAHVCCGLNSVGFGREQMPDVASLENEENNPVDGCNA